MNQSASVLIVDDEPHVRAALLRALRQTNYNLEAVAGADEAMQRLEEKEFQLVISDLKMPKTDGIEFLSAVGELYPHTGRVLLSGHAERHDLNDAINLCKVDQFIDKPWSNDDLVTSVEFVTEESIRKRDDYQSSISQYSELTAAMAMQLSLLPEPIENEEIKVKWMFQACRNIGGDALGYWIKDNRLHFYMIDVVGHGASAGMESFALQHLLNNRDLSDPAQTARELHAGYLYKHDLMRYFTMVAGSVDLATRELTFCQAGHPAPLVVDNDRYQVHKLGQGGYPIGLIEEAEFENQQVTLGPDQLLILHSDGLCDDHCDDLHDFVLMNSNMQPEPLADKVIEWREQRPVDDDISALFIKLS